jgi:hypothetical protein
LGCKHWLLVCKCGVIMSPTETLMLIGLGFALALVLVLLVGRGIWNMAMRLGARRHAKQIPTAMLELQADRDRLRAEHAMMSRKLEPSRWPKSRGIATASNR